MNNKKENLIARNKNIRLLIISLIVVIFLLPGLAIIYFSIIGFSWIISSKSNILLILDNLRVDILVLGIFYYSLKYSKYNLDKNGSKNMGKIDNPFFNKKRLIIVWDIILTKSQK